MLFRGKKLEFDGYGGYNLSTGRYIKYKPNLPSKKVVGGTVYGSEDLLREFELENDRERKIRDKNSTDVRDLDICEIGSMETFDLIGLDGIGKVKRVIDADTLELIIYVPLSFFKFSSGEGGFFTCVRARLNGIDFAESKTEEGMEATELMKELYRKNDNLTYFRIVRGRSKDEKYGRSLVELSSPDKEEYYNTKYLDKIAKTGKSMAKPYDGGTKNIELKSLPKCVKE